MTDQNPLKSPSRSGLSRLAPILWVAVLVAAVGAGAAFLLRERPVALAQAGAQAGDQAIEKCNIGVNSRIGGELALIDETGAPITQAAFLGKPTLLYFGFASCPDVCPMAMSTLGAAIEVRTQGAGAIQPVLVSLDPERDTPAVIGRYVQSGGFPPGLRGLTATTPDALEPIKKRFAVYGVKAPLKDSAMDYTIDHSSNFYLMDAQWKNIATFSSKMAPGDMAKCIDRALSAAQARG